MKYTAFQPLLLFIALFVPKGKLLVGRFGFTSFYSVGTTRPVAHLWNAGYRVHFVGKVWGKPVLFYTKPRRQLL